jgi:hypothetical protein
VIDVADIAFQIPDAPGTEIVVRRGFWTATKILEGGQPLSRLSGRKGPFVLPLNDGTSRTLSVRGFLNPSIQVDGQTYPLERRLRPYEYLLVGIPLLLAIPGITGGALGFALGFGGALGNARLARSAMHLPLRILSMVGLSVCLAVIYILVAVAVVTVVHPGGSGRTFAVGDCYQGSTSAPTTDSLSGVSCSVAHDSQVIGTPVDSGAASAYPGQSAVDAFANTACADAFAAFVGQAFDASAEGMFFFTPTADGWTAGDHTVICLAYESSGQKITGSLAGRGSGSPAP